MIATGPHSSRAQVVIPKQLEWEVRDKLDQKKMSEGTLFPDLFGLSCGLKRYYLPRPGGAIAVARSRWRSLFVRK